jgi:hypothetical protein
MIGGPLHNWSVKLSSWITTLSGVWTDVAAIASCSTVMTVVPRPTLLA